MTDLTKTLSKAQKMLAINLANGSIKAFSEGKQVQFRIINAWMDHVTDNESNPNPQFGAYEFRVKPVPREVWFPEFTEGVVVGYDSPEEVVACYKDQKSFIRAVRFVQQDKELK